MIAARLRVVAAGPHVTLQDGGRHAMMRFGLPASGGMDRKALAIANLALGNPAGATAIEVSLGGLTLDCQAGPITLAIAGGGFVVQAGTRRLGSWYVLTLHPGERLTLRPGPWGAWTYVAVAGQIVASRWLGSTSTHALSDLGGGKLVAGRDLTVDNARVLSGRAGPIPCPVWARPRARVHAVPGPQDRFFSVATQETLYATTWRLTDAYDRMGVRLRGPALPPEGALSIPSEPILRGSVQVSGDGVPTVLLADHQTTGGYPKIATLLDDDTDGFAQLRPHDCVSFDRVTPEQAVALARSRHRATAAYLVALGRAMAARDAAP